MSFDKVPSPKGAAVHIREFTRALGRRFGAVDLVTPDSAAQQPICEAGRWPGVDHHRLPAPGDNLIRRVMSFRGSLERFWSRRYPVVHFRSIFEGYPLAIHKDRVAERLVFEVNGLPSVELKYHHPDVATDRELMRKLRHQEGVCLDAADLIVTPSEVTAGYLVERGAAPDKVRVIPNGVHPELFAAPDCPPREWPIDSTTPARILYAGTMTGWQGTRAAIEALALYRRDLPATLTLIGPTRGRQRRSLEAQCADAGVLDYVEVLPALSQSELAALHHEHDAVLAPLLANDRNTVQGCCPLKILEAMASGVPLIASDLPVVRALVRADSEAILVRPGSSKALKDGMLRLRHETGLGRRLAAAARRRATERFTWDRAGARLVTSYEALLAGDGDATPGDP